MTNGSSAQLVRLADHQAEAQEHRVVDLQVRAHAQLIANRSKSVVVVGLLLAHRTDSEREQISNPMKSAPSPATVSLMSLLAQFVKTASGGGKFATKAPLAGLQKETDRNTGSSLYQPLLAHQVVHPAARQVEARAEVAVARRLGLVATQMVVPLKLAEA
jgi:hypothetical protein